MAVYVDPLRDWGWRLGPSCHMAADTLQELHDFAQMLGLRRAWFQGGPRPHYDLTAGKRAAAVKKGAIEATDREFMEALKKLRQEQHGSTL